MKTILGILTVFALSFPAFAVSVEDLQRNWAVANYELTGEARSQAFEALVEQAEQAVSEHPNDAATWIWHGIINSTYAGEEGGLSALKFVKTAKASLERAMEIDDKALDGSAYTSLGALYYQVPGWPIAFGSDKKARELLQRAVEINPDGIDPNYFFGDFLINQKEYTKAKEVLNKALSAPPRPGREVADTGRRNEIRGLLEQIETST